MYEGGFDLKVCDKTCILLSSCAARHGAKWAGGPCWSPVIHALCALVYLSNTVALMASWVLFIKYTVTLFVLIWLNTNL